MKKLIEKSGKDLVDFAYKLKVYFEEGEVYDKDAVRLFSKLIFNIELNQEQLNKVTIFLQKLNVKINCKL